MEEQKLYKVYTHTTPDGWVYVGVTCQDLKQRWRPSHYKETSLQPYIEQFGWDAIKHEVIYTTPDREEAYQVEEEMRQYYTEKGCCINVRRSGLLRAKDEKAYMRQWREDNKEEKAAYDRQWQKNHRKERADYKRQWYKKKKLQKAS